MSDASSPSKNKNRTKMISNQLRLPLLVAALASRPIIWPRSVWMDFRSAGVNVGRVSRLSRDVSVPPDLRYATILASTVALMPGSWASSFSYAS